MDRGTTSAATVIGVGTGMIGMSGATGMTTSSKVLAFGSNGLLRIT